MSAKYNYKYFQLLRPDYKDLVKGNDNPAGISDGEDGRTARKIARAWMKETGVKEAVLVINAVKEDGGDDILSVKKITVQ